MKPVIKKEISWQEVLAIISIIVLIISILPLLKVSFYDRATGDDYGYGAVTRQALLQTHSPVKMVSAAAKQVKDFWYSYQGTWFSVFLFAFQPEVFSLNAYWITAWIALALTISSVSVFLHTILVSIMGWPREEFITVDCCIIFIMLQFVYSPRSAIFWFNGMAHYVVPLALALFSMSCFIKYIQNKKIRYVIISSIMMALLGGMSYLSAFMAPLFLILLWIMNHKKGRYIWKLAVPFGLECIGLVVSAAAPGNANRGGSGYSLSLGRAVSAVGQSVLQGTTAVSDFFTQKPLVFLIMSVMILAAWSAARRSDKGFGYSKPLLVIVWLYLIYCAMYWPGIFANVDVSGGVPNTIFQVFILMFALGAAYLAGYFVKVRKKNSSRVLKNVWICIFVVLCGFTFVNKGTIKNATSYITIEYLRSGQADDYKKQMDEFTSIMTDPSVTDAKVHASNNEQGPLMHMPITDDPEKFTNDAAARFFGKNSVIAVDK